MNKNKIHKEIEEKLLNSYQNEQVDFIKSNPDYYPVLISLAFSNTEPLNWRAAYLIANSMEKNDKRLTSHIDIIIENLPRKKDGHQREFIKILSQMKLNDDQEGEFYELCYKLCQHPGKQASVKVYALKFIIRMVKKYPELKSEAEFLSQKQFLSNLSHGVLNSYGKLLNTIGVKI